MYIENNALTDVANHVVTRRGLTQLYQKDAINHCPACGHMHWLVGRSTAECAFCEMALPLAGVVPQAVEPLFFYRGKSCNLGEGAMRTSRAIKVITNMSDIKYA